MQLDLHNLGMTTRFRVISPCRKPATVRLLHLVPASELQTTPSFAWRHQGTDPATTLILTTQLALGSFDDGMAYNSDDAQVDALQ